MAYLHAEDLTPCLSHALSCLKKADLKFRKEQIEAITLVSSGKDVFLWLPTGLGKSICYQSLLFVFDHKLGKTSTQPEQWSVILVLSLLVSLMVDQVTSPQWVLATKDEVMAGKLFIAIATEAVVSSDRWRELLLQEPLSRQIVVDEAHSVYKW